MLILLKQSLKTTFLPLLFMGIGTYLQAGNAHFHKIENGNKSSHAIICESIAYKASNLTFFIPQDTVSLGKSEPTQVQSPKSETFSIPSQLANLPFNFRINSSISYLNFNHFTGNESRELFLQALLKKKELQKLSVLTDSLRDAYSHSSLEQREEISSRILKAEEQSIALNGDIPLMFQKARDQEAIYWQSASPAAIIMFQEKISQYNDSIAQSISGGSKNESTAHAEIPDTITLNIPTPKAVQNTAPAAQQIIYKIQIGAFKGKIPDASNKLIKKISILRKIENHVDDKGMKVYTTGHLTLYPEAVTMLGQVKQEGIKNAVIIAFQNGKRTTVMQARKLNNEL